MKNYCTLFFLFLLLTGTKVWGQQDPQLSQYIFNRMYLNPAATATDPDWIEATLTHRSQWLAYRSTFDQGGSPHTQLLTLSLPLSKYRLGLGIHLMNDQLGPLRNLDAKLSLAYHINLAPQSTLSFGVRAGFFNQRIAFNTLRFVDPDDPLDIGKKRSQTQADYALGVYYKNGKYFAGISLKHPQQSKFSYKENLTFSTLKPHGYLLLGKNFHLSPTIDLLSSLLTKTDFNSYSLEGNLMAEFNKKFLAGVSLRELEAISLMAGIYFMKDNRMRLSYAFDYTLQARKAKAATSHEIVLSYRIPSFKFPENPVIRTPRFRF